MKLIFRLSILVSVAWVAPTWAQTVHGVLQVVKGDVKVQSGKTGKTVKARIGGKVYPKDIVITGKDSRAKIVMVDNNVLNISPESKLEIEAYEYKPAQGRKNVLLNVLYGKVRSKVEQRYDGEENKFQVKTPTAVAGVRGTDFLASFSQSSKVSQVVTFKGEVAFGLPGPNNSIVNPVLITPGLASEIAGNAPPPPPQPVAPTELANLDRDSQADAPPSQPGNSGNGSDPRAPAGDDKKEPEKKNPDSASRGNQSYDGDDNNKGGGNDKNGNNGQRPQAGGVPAPTPGSGEPGNRQPGSVGPLPAGAPSSPGAGPMPGPAGMDPGSMLRPEDFATSPGGVMPEIGGLVPQLPPPLPDANQLPVCDFCNRLIEDSQTKLIIHVSQ